MKFNKTELKNALSRMSNFVTGNADETQNIHLHCENKKGMMFATDLISAGRTYFDVEFEDKVDICLPYKQFVQAIKVRSNEINCEVKTNENGTEMVEFFDAKTKFVYANNDFSGVENAEKSTKIPERGVWTTTRDMIVEAFNAASYAANEKETQNLFIAGTNFVVGKDGIVSLASTDRTRIAQWKSIEPNLIPNEEEIIGLISCKAIKPLNLFNKDEKVTVYLDENKVIFASETFEIYAPIINAQFPDVSKFFAMEEKNSYLVNVNEVKESLGIVGGNVDTIYLEFTDNTMIIKAQLMDGQYISDEVSCEKISGDGNDNVMLSAKMFADVFSHSIGDKVKIIFRGDNKLFSYETGNASGLIAPKKR